MAKAKIVYVCQECQNQFSTWSGRCSSCGQWNTLVEQFEDSRQNLSATIPAKISILKDISEHSEQRLLSGNEEFDRVLGSSNPGLVAGSVVLLAGTPGVGKSTLLLEIAQSIKGSLYISAEESAEQLRLRALRLGLKNSQLKVSSERNLSSILAAVEEIRPPFVVIDSVQTIFDESIAGTPGSINQVRGSCWRLMEFAKQRRITFLIVGHVTKEGTIAGPKALEHLVDVVLYLEGERRTGLRILRCEKNRFGSTDEVGIWQLTGEGFASVPDPGELFASLIDEQSPGRSLSVALEGSRAFLIEIQALATKTSFGYPKRTSQGIDLGRLNLLLAVLENHLNLPISQYDIYANIVGGFTVHDPGIDLAIAGAVISAIKKQPLDQRLVLIGEVGLLGEIRVPSNRSLRSKEASRLKYKLNPQWRSLKQMFKTNSTNQG